MAERDESQPEKSRRTALATTALDSSDDGPLPPPVVVDAAAAPDATSGAPDTPTDPFIGKVLAGLYQVESQIGEGGMGTVYKVRHVHLHKHFAVKVLSSRIAADRQAVERLRQEAVAASSIDHDNIVDVVSFDTSDDGDVFIVMELLKGAGLADVLEAGRVPFDRAIHIAIQICRALHAAHERGIVHRDLKPENVFVCRKHDRDFVKVLDFGISKVKTAEAEQVRMTKTGQLVGTPLYMSPEQARGEHDIDRRADVYALGVILYEMLTGTPPFEGGNYFQLLWKHGNEPPQPPAARCPEANIPLAVEAVIMRALAKTPADRFQTMKELEDAIVAAADGVPLPDHLASLPSFPSLSRSSDTPESVPPPPRSSRALVLGLGALALVLAGVGVVVATRDDGPSRHEPVVFDTDPATAHEDTLPHGGGDHPLDPLPEGVGTPGELVEPTAPETVMIDFSSRPAGATVSVDGNEIGATPIVAPLAAGDTPVVVTFSHEGYVDDVVRVVPAQGARVEGRLRPLHRQGTGGSLPPGAKGMF